MGDNAVSSADASRLLDAFEEAIDELRIAYEKYFLGIDRQAPAHKHRAIKLQMHQLERLRVRSTAVRFRLAGLRSRLVTYEHYWNRILGQIERGVYRRDIQQRMARRGETPEPIPEAGKPIAGLAEAVAASAPSTAAVPRIGPPPPPGPGAKPPPPPAPPVPGMRSNEIHRLFDDLVQAKQAAGEDTRGLTVKALARKLSRELPKLRERHGSGVEFEVATVSGRVTLRARTRGR